MTQSNGNLVVDCDTATETTTGTATMSTPRPVSANTNSLKKRKILQDCSLNFSPDLSSGLDLVRLKQYQQRMPDVMHMDDIHQDAVELAELLMATFANKRHLINSRAHILKAYMKIATEPLLDQSQATLHDDALLLAPSPAVKQLAMLVCFDSVRGILKLTLIWMGTSEVDMCQPVAVQSASVADQIHMPQLQLL